MKVKSFLLENRTTRQTVAKNSVWMALGQIGGRLLRAVIIVYAARVLGAAGWGTFSYAVSLAALLTIFVDLGIGPILTRETAKTTDPRLRSKILSTAFFVKVALMTVAVLVVIFIAPLFTKIEAAKGIFTIVALIFIFDTLREFGFSLTRALERMEWEAGLFILTNVAIVAAGFLTLAATQTVKAFALAYAIGTGVGTAATVYVLRHHIRKILVDFERKLVRPILTAGWPIAVSGILGGLMINTDLLFIGFFRSAEEVGYYSVAERIIMLLYLIPGVLASSIFPAFSRLAASGDGEKVRGGLERVLSITLAVAIPITLVGIILAPGIIETLFGASYLPATNSFRVLLLALVFTFPTAILSNTLFAYNRQKSLITFALIGGIGNVVFDLLLIPRFGIIGSAIATLIAQGVSNLYLWGQVKRVSRFRVLPHLKKIAPAALLVGATVWLLALTNLHPLIILALAPPLYLALLYRLEEPLLKEIKLIRQALA